LRPKKEEVAVSRPIWQRVGIIAVVGLGLLAGQARSESGFDLEVVNISTGIGNADVHGAGVHGRVSSPELVEQVLVRNPSGQVVADSDSSEFIWWPDDPDSFGLWSEAFDASTFFPGIYEIEVHYTDATSELRRLDVPEHLFCSVVPTGFSVVDWWLPGGGGIPQPTFGWDPFQSPEFDPPNEHLDYMLQVDRRDPRLEVWIARGLGSGTTQVDYNFDGSALPGYETLPPGSYDTRLFALEFQDYSSYSLDVSDEYGTWRQALVATEFTVIPEPATLLLFVLGGLIIRRLKFKN